MINTLAEAIELLNQCQRDELRDHAFGDAEVYWLKGDLEIASGYFSGDAAQVYIGDKTFAKDEARQLRNCGSKGAVERNDETGSNDYREGETMPTLTLDGVRKEICNTKENH